MAIEQIIIDDIQLRRNDAATWTTNNPTLLDGELGFERDTYKVKIGNGVDDWNTLSYTISDAVIGQLSDLSDVTSASPANRFALLGTGTTFISRALVLQDITDYDPNNIISDFDTALAQTRWKAIEVPTGGTTNQVLAKSSGTNYDVGWQTPSSNQHVIQEEGGNLTARTNLNFIGANVTATDNVGNDATDISIDGVKETADYTSLAAITGMATGDLVYVKADGIAGLFQYDSTLSATDDGGVVKDGWVRQYDGWTNVKWFGAVGNGIADDTAAIQSAIDVLKPNTGAATNGLNKSGIVLIPTGTYMISSKLDAWSGVIIKGIGPSTTLESTTGFTGDRIISLEPVSAGYYSHGGVQNLAFRNAGTVFPWCIAQGATTLYAINSVYSDLVLTVGVKYGLNFDVDIQHSTIERIYTNCPIEQILYLDGNHNVINKIDKEGQTGTTTEPYIHIINASSCAINEVLLEGTGNANKTPLKIEDSDGISIKDLWTELSVTDGTSLTIDNSQVELIGFERLLTTTKIDISNNSTVTADFINFNRSDNEIDDFITIDGGSSITIGVAETRRGTPKVLDKPQIDLKKTSYTTGETEAGRYNNTTENNRWGGNLIENPSFEAGRFGWSMDASGGSTTTEEYIPSDICSGLMGHFILDANGLRYIRQNVNITADMVGNPITVSGAVRLVNNSGTVRLTATGVGIVSTSATGLYRFDQNSTEWQKTSATVIPQTTGNMTIGLYVSSAIEFYFDDFAVRFGTQASGSEISSKLIDLDGHSITYNSAAPTSGTWRAGDIVYNTAPSSTNMGWICTVSGTSGTWEEIITGGGGDMVLATAQTSTGKKTFSSDATNSGLRLLGVTVDPSAPVDGDMWHRTDIDTIKIRTNSISSNIATDSNGLTFTNKAFDANGTGNSLSNVDVADLANGIDGELITWDASGVPDTVAVGTATHVLTSNGVGVAPTFQAAPGGAASTGTGTAFSITNTSGYYYNMASANSGTTYTTTGTTTGAWAQGLINAASEPVVTGATKEGGAEFIASTDMYIVIYHNGTAMKFYFVAIATGASAHPAELIIAASDETAALTTGTGKVTFRMPYAMTVTEVRASLTGAGSTSGTTTIDINEGGTTILSTKLTIDFTDKTSVGATTAPVISDSALADDAEITIDIDAVTGGADETGLKVTLIGTRT